MTVPTPHAVLERLADPGITRAEAEDLMASLDGQETAGVVAAFRWLHDRRDEAALHGAVMLLVHWADRPVARALPPALRALLDEPAVGDLNKLAAADLLERLGAPVDRGELALRLRDPEAVARAAVRAALASVDEPLALVNLLDALSSEPLDLVLALIDDLTALADPRGAAVLAPLTQSADPDVAVSAVLALESLGAAAVAPTLALVAAHHPDTTVRRQADAALARLPAAPPRPVDPAGAQAWLTTLDGAGGQYVVLARSHRGAVDVLTIHHTDTAGVLQYAASERMTADELTRFLARLATGGRQAVPVPPGAAAWALEAAAGRTLSTGGATALGYAAWPWVLGPVTPEVPLAQGDPAELPPTDGAHLAARPELAGWALAPAEGPLGEPAAVVAATMDDAAAARWARRLRHQAWLLARAGQAEPAAWAQAAAARLERAGAAERASDPFLLALAGRRRHDR